jgi:hypothetical protein
MRALIALGLFQLSIVVVMMVKERRVERDRMDVGRVDVGDHEDGAMHCIGWCSAMICIVVRL